MWNKSWKTYKQRKLSNRSNQIKDLHNHTNSRQNQSKHRMPANVSVKGGKTKRTLKTRGKNACWDAPGKSAFMLAFCFSIQRNIFDAFRYKEGGPLAVAPDMMGAGVGKDNSHIIPALS